MPKFIKTKLGEKKFKDSKEVTLKITRSDKKKIDIKNITELYEDLKDYDKDAKIRIRALGPTRWSTLAGYESGLMVDDYEEYFHGKVVNAQKFNNFTELQVTMLRKN